MTIGIVALGEVCARQRAIGLDLFEALGAWVTDTDDPALQRLFAEAAHRHAWHADLWRGRAPAIPPVDIARATDAHRSPVDAATDDRAGHYADCLRDLAGDLDTIDADIDETLDPATRRVIGLVRHDVDELAARLTALRPT